MSCLYAVESTLDNLSAVSRASPGTCGCGQVRANRLKRTCSYLFLSSMFWKPFLKFLKGGSCKTMVCYSSRSTPLNKFNCSSRIKPGIRRTPAPHPFWKPKNNVGEYISCGQVKYLKEISWPTPQTFQGYWGGCICQYNQLFGNKSYGQGYDILEPQAKPLRGRASFFAMQIGYII